MTLHHTIALVAAGTVLLQVATCQDSAPVLSPLTGVSMTVFAEDGPVGYPCEPFQCVPHKVTAGIGGKLAVDVYGKRGTFYALLGGMPTTACQPIGGLGGALVLGNPAFTLGFGGISDFVHSTDCDVGVGQTTFWVPMSASVDLSFRLQGVSFATFGNGVEFTRGVEVDVQ